MKIIPYKGDLPYAFISYAHTNSNIVYPVVAQMQEDGYRIWCDQGIESGSKWVQNIVDHLEKSSCVIAFVTRDYLSSISNNKYLAISRSMISSYARRRNEA